MGQGTESCGGYEVEYDPYEDGLAHGEWMTSNGEIVSVPNMTVTHLRGARRAAYRASKTASFTCDIWKWEQWVELFDAELARRDEPAVHVAVYDSPLAVKATRGLKVTLVCWCGTKYTARVADLSRGWARSCCKSHAATKREFGRKEPVEDGTGRSIKQILRGQS